MLSLTALALWIAFKDDDGSTLLLFKNIKWYWIIILIAYVFFYHSITGWILFRLTKYKYTSYRLSQGIINTLIATFFHAITPGASGGQFMQVYVFRKQRVNISDAASILWMDYIVYQASMVTLVAILLFSRFNFILNYNFNLFLLVMLGFIVSGSLIIGMWLITRFSKLYHWLITKGVNFVLRIKLIKDKESLKQRIAQGILRFEQELETLKTKKRLIMQIAGANVFRISLMYAFPFLCAMALKVDVNVNDLWLIVVLSACVHMAAMLYIVPGASGGIELTFLIFFTSLFGVVGARSLMVIWRFFTYYFIVLVSGLLFVVFKQYYLFKEKKMH